ncbi:MAG: hypothetical protein LBT89_05085, partial [Planctomycetaceae bacterium]|nr:hypothetical protein [Planctomycetaceae bacterium]
MKRLTLSFVFIFSVSFSFADETIKHKMLLLDESRGQLLYVDESDSSKNWIYTEPDGKGRVWDMQLIGGHKLLIAATDFGGFREIDMKTHKVVREVIDAKYKPTRSAVRLSDGRTVLGIDKKNTQIAVLDKDGKETKFIDRTDTRGIRLLRRTPRNTILFGGQNDIYEITFDGEELRRVTVPNSRYNYQTLELPNGHWLVATGYGCQLLELDKDGKALKTFGGNPPPAGLWYLFYSKFQVLPNGHIVLATWTGHGAKDSDKGQQLVEFDRDGKIVWTWHDTKLAGSLNGVIVLDHLDT